MIIGKKTVALLLLLSVLLALLAGCGSNNDEAAMELLRAMKNQAAEQTEGDIPKQYLIVIPASASSELSLLARDLSTAIAEKTGVESVYKYDTEEIRSTEGTVVILVGNTSSAISRDALYRFKSDDYICKNVDGKVVLGGVSDSATVAAINRFINEVLPNATKYALMADGAGFEYRGEYAVKDIIVCGYDLRDYSIIYSDIETQKMAVELRNALAERSGIYLDVKSEAGSVDGQKEIVLSVDGESGACIRRIGEDIFLLGKDTYALSVSVSEFYDALMPKSGDTASFDVSDRLELAYTSSKISIRSVVCDIPYNESVVPAISTLVNTLNNAQDDIIIFSKIDRDVWNAVKPGLNSEFETVELEMSDRTLIPIICRRQNIVITESSTLTSDGEQTLRLVVTHIASGEEYVVYCVSDDIFTGKTVNSLLKDATEPTFVTVMAPENKNEPFATEDNVSVAYSGVHYVSGTEYRHVIALAYSHLGHNNVESIDAQNTSHITLDLYGRYCSQYKQLISKD
jgi:hypothetical protein